MPPIIATVIYLTGVVGLYWLDRDPKARISKALWIPTTWLLLTGSRPVSMWLGMTPSTKNGSVYLEGSPIDRVVFLTLVVAALAVVINRKEQIGRILVGNWPVFLFFAYAAFSILWSDYPFVTFKHWIKGLGDVSIILIVLTEPVPLDAMKRLVTRVGFTLLPLSVLLCKYYPGVGGHVNISWVMEWTGVATQKNGLGEICAVYGLALLWRFCGAYNDRQDPARVRRLFAHGTVFGMAVWLLWMCNSLTSICALAMASALMLLSTRAFFRAHRARVHILVGAFLALTVYALFFQSSGTLVGDLGRSPTLSGRTEIWSAALSIPVSRMVGAGYESFWLGPRVKEVQSVTGQDTTEAHDGYTEVLLNLGGIGVAILGLLIATGYRNIIGAYRSEAYTGSLRAAFFLETVITAFTEAAFRMMDPPWIFFLLATIDTPPESLAEARSGGGLVEYQVDLLQEAGAGVSE